jgi:subtilisin family serine protease
MEKFSWRKFIILFLIISLISGFLFFYRYNNQSENQKPEINYKGPGRYLVQKSDEIGSNNSLIPKALANAKKVSEKREWFITDINNSNELIELQNTKVVRKIIPDLKRYINSPNDTFYNSQNTFINGQFDQWNLRQIGFTPTTNPSSAWNISTGSADTIVAVIDTGIALRNPDIGGGSGVSWVENNLWINQGEIPATVFGDIDADTDNIITSLELINYFIANNLDVNSDGLIDFLDMISTGSPLRNNSDNDSNGYSDDIFSFNFVTNDPNVDDTGNGSWVGHGTHVAGIIASVTNNNSGISGICWTCKIMPLKVINQFGFGFDSDIVNAIDYAVANGAKVINMSLGGPGYSEILDEAIEDAFNAGVSVISASGNDAASASDSYPGGSKKSISVGSNNWLNQISGFSNTGQRLDLVAPGETILSTYRNVSSGCVGAGYYACLLGTSMASPHVAGVAALLYDINKDDPDPWHARDIRANLLLNTEDLFGVGFDNSSGFGRVNALSTLQNAEKISNDAVLPVSTLNTPASSIVKGTISINGTATDDNLYLYTLSIIRVSDSYIVKQLSGRNNISNSTLTSFNTTTLTDGVYNIRMDVEDFYGNITTSNTVQITVDNTPPSNFSLSTPSNNFYTINPRPNFSWTASTDLNGVNYDLILNNNVYAEDLNTTSFTPASDLTDGVYTWSVRAQDSPGNIRQTSNRTLTLDRVPPNTFNISVNISGGTTPTFTFSTTDALSGIDYYKISIDGGGFVTVTSPYTPGAQSAGAHSAVVRAYDKAGNFRESSVNYNISDVCVFKKSKADFNCDGVVNIRDLSILASSWLKTGAGDANGDGVTNIVDLSILASNWLKNF